MKISTIIAAAWTMGQPSVALLLAPTHRRKLAAFPRSWRSRHAATLPAVEGGRVPRRGLLGGSLGAAAAGFLGGGGEVASAAHAAAQPLVDIPLRRLKLPKGGVGRDYVLVPVVFAGSGKVEEFLLDSGDALEMVTPSLQAKLGLMAPKASGAATVEGTTAGGSRRYNIVELEGASVSGQPLPTLHATVADFPQEHLDPKHDVTGVLGFEFMNGFDVDLDFPRGRLRLWPRGAGAAVAATAGLAELPAAVVPGGVLGVRAAGSQATGASEQPFLGIVDSGASFTILNTPAAALAGVPKSDLQQAKLRVAGMGFDGKPMAMPLVKVALELDGNLDPRTGRFATVAKLPPLLVGVGDLPVFRDLLGSIRTPAAILGIDLWAQGRLMVLGAADHSHARTLFWKRG